MTDFMQELYFFQTYLFIFCSFLLSLLFFLLFFLLSFPFQLDRFLKIPILLTILKLLVLPVLRRYCMEKNRAVLFTFQVKYPNSKQISKSTSLL